MARLLDLPGSSPELTDSLAQSLKNGLLTPTEKKFNTLAGELVTLQKEIEAETRKLSQEMQQEFNKLDAELEVLKKLYRASILLTAATMAGIITALVILFRWL